jgi:hypothetical protein
MLDKRVPIFMGFLAGFLPSPDVGGWAANRSREVLSTNSFFLTEQLLAFLPVCRNLSNCPAIRALNSDIPEAEKMIAG